MCYLVIAKNSYDRFIKIYQKKELTFYSEEEELELNNVLFLDDDLKKVCLNNIEVSIFDLSKFVENETSEWNDFYTLHKWENIFWIIGYDFKRSNEDIWDEIIGESSKTILFYIQNISFLVNIIDKGSNFERFYSLCNYYNENILKKEKNKIFIDLMEKYKEEWLII